MIQIFSCYSSLKWVMKITYSWHNRQRFPFFCLFICLFVCRSVLFGEGFPLVFFFFFLAPQLVFFLCVWMSSFDCPKGKWGRPAFSQPVDGEVKIFKLKKTVYNSFVYISDELCGENW